MTFTILEDAVKHDHSLYSSIIFKSISMDETVGYVHIWGCYPSRLLEESKENLKLPDLSLNSQMRKLRWYMPSITFWAYNRSESGTHGCWLPFQCDYHSQHCLVINDDTPSLAVDSKFLNVKLVLVL